MNRLALLVLDDGVLVDDWSYRIDQLSANTDERGFSTLSGTVRYPRSESLAFYDGRRVLDIALHNGAEAIWEGRMEDVAIVPSGLEFEALGAWVVFNDVPYTSVWSDDRLSSWQVWNLQTQTEPIWTISNQLDLYVAPTNSTVHSSSNPFRWAFNVPHRATGSIVQVEFDYDLTATNDWEFIVSDTASDIWGGGLVILVQRFNLVGNGGTQTGSQTIALDSNSRAVTFALQTSAAGATYTPDTGTDFLRISNVRVVRSTTTSAWAQLIIRDLVTQVNSVNSGSLNSDTALVQSNGLDLRQEVYQDENMADLLRYLGGLGDADGNRWVASVWSDRRVQFEPRGESGRTWYVRVDDLTLQNTIQELKNSVYGVFQNEQRQTRRTTTAVDTASVGDYGLTRRLATRSQTSEEAQAETLRDFELADKATARPRVQIELSQVRDADGTRWPLYYVRANDTLVIDNLSAVGGEDVDLLRTFYIAETQYNVVNDTLSVTPERSLPTLTQFLAQQEATT